MSLLGRIVGSRTVIVSLVGPDGAGKSTVIEGLAELLPDEIDLEVRHWRPGLLPSLGSLLGRTRTVVDGNTPPRRSGGAFSLGRLGYYWFDFLLGGWWIAARSNRRGLRPVILYDRCALDMAVDPVRYGLRSTRGTMVVWRTTPQPDLVLLLVDEPARIRDRKSDLTEREISAQLDEWRDLARAGHVQGGLRVDAPAAEISRRVEQPLMDLVYGDERRARDGGGYDGETERLLTALGFERIGSRSPQPAGSSRMALVPRWGRGRMLIPLGSRRAALSSLQLYHPRRPIARLAKRILGVTVSLGLSRPLLGSGGVVEIGRSLPDGNRSFLSEHLRATLGASDLTLAVALGTPGSHRKPLIQVMGSRGEVHAYVKVGWNPATVELIEREERALHRLSDIAFSRASVPRVMESGWCNDLRLLVLRPPETPWRAGGSEFAEEHLTFTAELHESTLTKEPIAVESWATRILRRVLRLREKGCEYDAHLVEWMLDRCRPTLAAGEVALGACHGDFTPWNTLRVGRRMFVLDWEYFDTTAPVGWDFFHFVAQSSVLVDRLRGHDVARRLVRGHVRRKGEELLRRLDVSVDLYDTLLGLYLADVASAYFDRDVGAAPGRSTHLHAAWRSMLFLFASGAVGGRSRSGA